MLKNELVKRLEEMYENTVFSFELDGNDIHIEVYGVTAGDTEEQIILEDLQKIIEEVENSDNCYLVDRLVNTETYCMGENGKSWELRVFY